MKASGTHLSRNCCRFNPIQRRGFAIISQDMNPDEIENIELDLLLEALNRRYQYDFRHYARASLRRRVRHALTHLHFDQISDLIPALLRDEELAQRLLLDLSVTVTEMFRDPAFYQSLRRSVLPYLSTYPFFKVWLAGCAGGQEAYSLAILLHEEKLYERSTVYATDFNPLALEKAREGIYPLKHLQQYTSNYQKAGGKSSFSDYYHAEYASAIMSPSLKTNLTFARHNLVSDGIFSEVQLVFCRNVLIYFDRALQNWALSTLTESLSRGGFLCLGVKESLEFSEVAPQFKLIDPEQKIYQKRGGSV